MRSIGEVKSGHPAQDFRFREGHCFYQGPAAYRGTLKARAHSHATTCGLGIQLHRGSLYQMERNQFLLLRNLCLSGTWSTIIHFRDLVHPDGLKWRRKVYPVVHAAYRKVVRRVLGSDTRRMSERDTGKSPFRTSTVRPGNIPLLGANSLVLWTWEFGNSLKVRAGTEAIFPGLSCSGRTRETEDLKDPGCRLNLIEVRRPARMGRACSHDPTALRGTCGHRSTRYAHLLNRSRTSTSPVA